MPEVIAAALIPLLTGLGASLATATFIATCPQGEVCAPSISAADDDGLFLRHVWPHDVRTRGELIARLCARPESTSRLKSFTGAIVRRLAGTSDRQFEKMLTEHARHGRQETCVEMALSDEMRPLAAEMDMDEPGKFKALLADGYWPHMTAGLCLEPMISESAMLFSNSRLAIRKGDLVAYAAKGSPTMACKVFLGDGGGKVFMWCNKPAAVYILDYDQLIHVSRVALVKQTGEPLKDARELDFSPLFSQGARKVMSMADDVPFIAPKEMDILYGLGIALADIVEAIRALPDSRLAGARIA